MELADKVRRLGRGEIGGIVESRMKEFRENSRSGDSIFSELCFCICTAGNSAERGLRAQREIDFANVGEDELRRKMRRIVCRFHNRKSGYILSARGDRKRLLGMLAETKSGKEARDWLNANIRGIGMKEASHFLRNIGYRDVAIIDFHIMDLLSREGLIERGSLTPARYIAIERVLEGIAKEAGVSLAELDLYLWYMETGELLK